MRKYADEEGEGEKWGSHNRWGAVWHVKLRSTSIGFSIIQFLLKLQGNEDLFLATM